MINLSKISEAFKTFEGQMPFDHCVVDDFFDIDVANKLSDEFMSYDDPSWFFYNNPLEHKKACNDWNRFPKLTYSVFSRLTGKEFTGFMSSLSGITLYPDQGLHGGGWHMHGQGGILNPHLDYNIHPKLGLQRVINIIIYLSDDLKPEHGGHLGFWSHDHDTMLPNKLITEIQPEFNRAVIFNTMQNSWHGISRPLVPPETVYRKSLAVYYLKDPDNIVDSRARALYAPRTDQMGDPKIQELIRLRKDVSTSDQVYVKR
jgi:hypothetical protein